MFKSIRSRLVVVFIIFFMVIEAVQFISIYLTFNNAFLISKQNTMLDAYTEINDYLIDDPTVFEDIKDVMLEYETTTNIYFCLVNRSTDEILYSTNDSINPDYFDFTNVSDKVYDEAGNPKQVEGFNSNKWLVMYRTIETSQSTYNAVIWTCYETELNNTILTMWPLIAAMAVIALAVGILLALFFSYYIVKPIQEIDESAQAIASQDFTHIIHLPKSKDEIYRLAKSVNTMSAQLERDMITLKTVNLQLTKDLEKKNQLDKMRRDFLSNVSHELKTPLAILSSYAEMLITEGDNIDRDEYINVIMDEAQEMTKLVGNLLSVSRMENATEYMSLEPTNISELVEGLAESRYILFSQENLTFDVLIQPDLYALADSFYISQAFDNYLSNALKYTTKNGTVKVSLFANENHIVFNVDNTAEHIDNDDLDKLWNSFYKVDSSRTQDGHMSVGLGLYIVKTIVDQHNGQVNVENLKDGVRFSVILNQLAYSGENEEETENENEEIAEIADN